MDNMPQNVLNLANSTLTAIPIRTNPSYDLWRTDNLDQSKMKGESSIKSTTRLIVVVMVLLLLVTLASVALSVTTYRQLTSEHSQVLSQLSKINVGCGDNKIQQHCGPGSWWRVAFLNMSDPSQECPSAWREYIASGVRACGRPITSKCPATTYFTGYQYSRICGRVIGYQVANPNGFRTSNEFGLDGVSITYGTQRNHVWSYVAGLSEMRNSSSVCPCSSQLAEMPPPLIGDNYYCESGNPSNIRSDDLFSNDPLWDGQQCEGTCCTGTNSPPWFSVMLPAPTMDMIEVNICLDQETDNEDTPVDVLNQLHTLCVQAKEAVQGALLCEMDTQRHNSKMSFISVMIIRKS